MLPSMEISKISHMVLVSFIHEDLHSLEKRDKKTISNFSHMEAKVFFQMEKQAIKGKFLSH